MSGLRTTRRPTATGPGLAEWWALLHRGAALLTQQEYRQALAEFERVIALDPQSAYASIAHHLRGHAYLELQELQAARQDFQRAQFYLEQALRVEPDWAACFWMGVVLASRNEGARARESLCQARMRSMPTALSLALNWLAPDQRAQLTS